MEIVEIKSALTLSQVLRHYHLTPDRNNRLKCPFHKDKTPSLQIYPKTNTAYCFSTNCQTHSLSRASGSRSLDVIDFIMYMENCTKHEAILKAKLLLGKQTSPETPSSCSRISRKSTVNERADLLGRIFNYFKRGVSSSQVAKDYLNQRCLDCKKLEIGYNSGQFHHSSSRLIAKDEALIKSCLKYGLLLDKGITSRTGEKAYSSFGKYGIVFPLRNHQNQIVSLYYRSTKDIKCQNHYYLKNRQGLYPRYPDIKTKKLILTEAIIDAASLYQLDGLKKEHEILALYGTNGLTEEHQKAIKELKELEEIIFFFDGDEAGKVAVKKYGSMLKTEYPQIKITNVEIPENEDVNSLLQSHEPKILVHLIQERKEINASQQDNFLFSNEIVAQRNEAPKAKEIVAATKSESSILNTSNPYNIRYIGSQAKYSIKGFRTNQLDSLKITLQIEDVGRNPAAQRDQNNTII